MEDDDNDKIVFPAGGAIIILWVIITVTFALCMQYRGPLQLKKYHLR